MLGKTIVVFFLFLFGRGFAVRIPFFFAMIIIVVLPNFVPGISYSICANKNIHRKIKEEKLIVFIW